MYAEKVHAGIIVKGTAGKETDVSSVTTRMGVHHPLE
jgi:hypothetical protein